MLNAIRMAGNPVNFQVKKQNVTFKASRQEVEKLLQDISLKKDKEQFGAKLAKRIAPQLKKEMEKDDFIEAGKTLFHLSQIGEQKIKSINPFKKLEGHLLIKVSHVSTEKILMPSAIATDTKGAQEFLKESGIRIINPADIMPMSGTIH